jgi:hypothetical protein
MARPSWNRVVKDPFPNLSAYRRQRVFLPAPPGGFRRHKPKRRKLSARQKREVAAVQRAELGISRAGVIIMAAVLVVVIALATIAVVTHL